ncbi:hypothetical protein BDF19DRAFT_468444 [Syncephalis fuscata]|nr:hypothetical protein BDF19DRAFT_468444 [Syncephalis fuscata]
MTRFASTIGFSACAAALLAVSTISSVSAHGYMSSPAPRGICRGEPAGKVTNVGHSVTLGLTITAPHIGMCEVYILDENLDNPRKIASKDGCAAPGKVGPWSVEIPSDITGRKVLRWVWNAAHLVTTIEHYEQCADINISGAPAKDTPAEDTPAEDTPAEDTPAEISQLKMRQPAIHQLKISHQRAKSDDAEAPKPSEYVVLVIAARMANLSVMAPKLANAIEALTLGSHAHPVLNAAAVVMPSTVDIK